MTFQELVNMDRFDLLKVWTDAIDSNNKELEDLAMSAMGKQNEISNKTRKSPGRKFKPQVEKTSGLSCAQLLRNIRLNEKFRKENG